MGEDIIIVLGLNRWPYMFSVDFWAEKIYNSRNGFF
jgi:hypothetical protein